MGPQLRSLFRLAMPKVACAQHEMSPVYCHSSFSADNNVLFMEVIEKEAEKLGLHALMHEKPFAGINGSGEHRDAEGLGETESGGKSTRCWRVGQFRLGFGPNWTELDQLGADGQIRTEFGQMLVDFGQICFDVCQFVSAFLGG